MSKSVCVCVELVDRLYKEKSKKKRTQFLSFKDKRPALNSSKENIKMTNKQMVIIILVIRKIKGKLQ
jgi:hypothetical protein